MPENTKQVAVNLPGTSNRVIHEGGDHVTVEDGHLMVFSNDDSRTAAIYAPGRWASAVVEERP